MPDKRENNQKSIKRILKITKDFEDNNTYGKITIIFDKGEITYINPAPTYKVTNIIQKGNGG